MCKCNVWCVNERVNVLLIFHICFHRTPPNMKIFIFVFIMALILAMIVSILGILKNMFSKLASVLFHVFWSIASSGDIRDIGSIPESGRYPGRGHGNTLQYSCLENPMDERAWQAIVHSVTKSQKWLKWPSKHARAFYLNKALEILMF